MYFGPKEVQEGSLMKHSFLNAIFKALPLSENKKPDIEPYVMKMALSKYSTNFKNMRDNTVSFYTMLNNLLMVLLRLHLAPKREENKQKRIEALKKKKRETKAERSRERTFTYVHLLNSQVPSMTYNTFYRYICKLKIIFAYFSNSNFLLHTK
ncbi:unnamed protein product [Rhizopus stolonifer]